MSAPCDIAVIGGGIMGCATALHLAEGGMRVIVLEAGEIGQGASGVNAGTLSLQIKRVRLMPYALRGHAEWARMGDAVGFRRTGGYTLAFTETEAALLRERQTAKAAAGAPIRFVGPNELAAAEPGLSRKVVLGEPLSRGRLCEFLADAGNSTGAACARRAWRCGPSRLSPRWPRAAGSRSRLPPARCDAGGCCWRQAPGSKPLAAMLGVALPVTARVNTVTVTERMPPVVGTVIGHATGLLTLKQKGNGTVLIGGGWQGRGAPGAGRGEVVADTLATNLALAAHAVPALSDARVLRSWTGFEAHVPDYYPLAGALPGVEGAFVLGCVRGGYTIGPCIGALMADFILGREPDLPLFDPARSFTEET